MSCWRPGDYATIQDFGNPNIDGEVVKLCSKIGDYHYAPTKFVPGAWFVQVYQRGEIDQRIVSEHVFTKVAHPNERDEWSHGPWQPIEHIKFP